MGIATPLSFRNHLSLEVSYNMIFYFYEIAHFGTLGDTTRNVMSALVLFDYEE